MHLICCTCTTYHILSMVVCKFALFELHHEKNCSLHIENKSADQLRVNPIADLYLFFFFSLHIYVFISQI